MSRICVRFNEKVGEIPQGTLGIFRMNIMAGDIDRTRVFIPRHYVGLSKDLLPCYDIRGANWVEVPEENLTEQERQELIDLDKEISDKSNLMVGPGGLIVTTMGNWTQDMLDNVLDKLEEHLDDEGEEWKTE